MARTQSHIAIFAQNFKTLFWKITSDSCWGWRMAESRPNLPGESLPPIQDRCRLCASKPQQKYQIFSKKAGVSANLHFLIKKYTEIGVRPDDGLPQIIYRNCQRVIINIEEKVDSLRKTAKKVRENFQQGGTAQKRCIDEKDREQVTIGEIATVPKKDTVHFPRYIRNYFLSSTRRPCDVLWWP